MNNIFTLGLMGRLLVLLGLLLGAQVAGAQNLTRLEYFYDTDPGYGLGNVVAFSTPAPTQDLTYTASTTGVSPGFHTLYTRVESTTATRRAWSLTTARPVFIGNATPLGAPDDLVVAEYYFDSPGYRPGTRITFPTAAPNVDHSFVADLSGLGPGLHTMYTRVRDRAGAWSIVNVHLVEVIQAVRPDLVYAEYFFDTDPGHGHGTRVAFTTPSASVDQVFGVSLTGLGPGLHTMYTRVRDRAGAWSIVNVHLVEVIQAVPPDLVYAEYFFDTDPGHGHGTRVAFTTPSASVDQVFGVSLTGLGPGLHTMYTRVRDRAGAWSIVNVHLVEVIQAVPPDLVYAEYFFDTDPGHGHGTRVAFTTPSASVDQVFGVSLTGLASGFHTMYTRVRDRSGAWSIVNVHSFMRQSNEVVISRVRYEVYPLNSNVPLCPATDYDLPSGTAANNVDQTFIANLCPAVTGDYVLRVAAVDALNIPSIDFAHFFRIAPPLPVELVEFTAVRQGSAARLAWRTASEKNSDYFAVEVSPDGRTFRPFARVPGQGTASAPTSYEQVDPGLLGYGVRVVYYRLRQVDRDGTPTFSPVRAVQVDGGVPTASLYPNPASGYATLDLLQLPAGAYRVTLHDATGRLVHSASYAAGQGYPLDLRGLASSVYLLRVEGGAGFHQQLRLTVQ